MIVWVKRPDKTVAGGRVDVEVVVSRTDSVVVVAAAVIVVVILIGVS